MSKKILFFLLFAGFGYLNSFSQDLKILYGISTEGLLNEEQKSKISPGTLEYFKKVQENFKHIEFVLKVKQDQAMFFRNEKMDNEGNKGVGIAASQASFFGTFYANSQTGETINEYDSYGPKYLITSKLDRLDWKIRKESKIVSGFKTFKATAKEEYNTGTEIKSWEITAWFAPEINKPFGPGGYGGLPGLILELKRGSKVYSVKSIKEVVLIEEDVEKPTKGKKVTRKEFEIIGEKMAEQMSSY